MTTRPKPGAPAGSSPGGPRRPTACVVVCEDDAVTQGLLCDHLVADNFVALPAASAADALRICHFTQPDLLLLDLGLSDASGLEVLCEIREGEHRDGRIDPQLAVIILSGRGAEAERIRGLEAGADDYLVKPFSYAELRARIDIVLRGARRREGGILCVGELLVDLARRRAFVRGREIALSRREFLLLALLASEPCRVFSRQELVAAVWGQCAEDRTRALDSHASRLRRKLDPEARSYVYNCWGIGYRLCESTDLGASSTGSAP